MPGLSSNLPARDASVQALAAPFIAATSTPLTETVADTAAHTFGPFTPQLARQIQLTLNATAAASGTAQLLRATDGATLIGLTKGGAAIGNFEFSAITGAIVNEPFAPEFEAAATYWLKIQITTGTVTVRIAQ